MNIGGEHFLSSELLNSIDLTNLTKVATLVPVVHSFRFNTNINFDEGHIKFDVLSKNYPWGNFLFKCNILVPCVFKSQIQLKSKQNFIARNEIELS